MMMPVGVAGCIPQGSSFGEAIESVATARGVSPCTARDAIETAILAGVVTSHIDDSPFRVRRIYRVIVPDPQPQPLPTLRAVRAAADCRAVNAALVSTGGRWAPAARILGVSRQGLAKIIERLKP